MRRRALCGKRPQKSYRSRMGHSHGKEPEVSYAVTTGSYGAKGASGVLRINPSIQLIRIDLTHYFMGRFKEANPVMNAEFLG